MGKRHQTEPLNAPPYHENKQAEPQIFTVNEIFFICPKTQVN